MIKNGFKRKNVPAEYSKDYQRSKKSKDEKYPRAKEGNYLTLRTKQATLIKNKAAILLSCLLIFATFPLCYVLMKE